VSDHHEKVLAFLGEALGLTHHQSCVKIELEYAQPGFRADKIREWSRQTTPEVFGDDATRALVFAQRLTSEVVSTAEGHADSYGIGKHRFVLRTFQALGSRTVCAFVISPSVDSNAQALAVQGAGPGVDGSGGYVTPGLADRPDGVGQIGQLMRHIENRDRLAIQKEQAGMQKDIAYINAMGHHVKQLVDENQALRQMLAEKDKQHAENLAAIEAARSQEHEREIQAKIVFDEQERKTFATKKVLALLPVIVSKWGRSQKKAEASGKVQSPLTKIIGELLASMDDRQRDHLQELLSTEQQIAFSEIASVVEEEPDSVLLPQMLYDLASSLKAQMGPIMAILNETQQKMFVQAISLANATQANNTKAGDQKASQKTEAS
jgi:hypothetical protein